MHHTLPPPGSAMILLHRTLLKYTSAITPESILAEDSIHSRSSHPFLASYPLESCSRSVHLPHISLNILEITPYPIRSGSKQPWSNLYKEGWFLMVEGEKEVTLCCRNLVRRARKWKSHTILVVALFYYWLIEAHTWLSFSITCLWHF